MESGGSQYELMSLFADGGVMMYPLVLCSLLALGVIIAKAWTLFVAHKDAKGVMNRVEESARSGRLDEAIQIAASTRGPTAAILFSGLTRLRDLKIRRGEVEAAVNTTGTIELGFLERGLVVLATIANVAPLMGFLGTVAGMIEAFASIEAAGNVDPGLVAGGIKVALLTTAAGLVIAIPVNIAYNFFVYAIDKLIVEMEQGTQEVLSLAWDLEKQGKLTVTSSKKARVSSMARPATKQATRPDPVAGEGGVADRPSDTRARPGGGPPPQT